MLLDLTIPIRPVPQGRPRLGKAGFAYTPPRTRQYVAAIREAARAVWADREAITGPIVVLVETQFQLPKSAKGRTHHTQRPDVDNLAKAVLDALNKLVFADDAQIVRLIASKAWSVAGPSVRVIIRGAE